jgi:hypothetical protein
MANLIPYLGMKKPQPKPVGPPQPGPANPQIPQLPQRPAVQPSLVSRGMLGAARPVAQPQQNTPVLGINQASWNKMSPQAQTRLKQSASNLKTSQANIFNPSSIINDIGSSVGSVVQHNLNMIPDVGHLAIAKLTGNKQAENIANQDLQGNWKQSIPGGMVDQASRAYNSVAVPVSGLVGAGMAGADKLFNGGKNVNNILSGTKQQMGDFQKQSFIPDKVYTGKATPLEFGQGIVKTGAEYAPYLIPGAKAGTPFVRSLLTNMAAQGVTGMAGDAINQIGSNKPYDAGQSLRAGVTNAAVAGLMQSGTHLIGKAAEIVKNDPNPQAGSIKVPFNKDQQPLELGSSMPTGKLGKEVPNGTKSFADIDTVIKAYKQSPRAVDLNAVRSEFKGNANAIKKLDKAQAEVKVEQAQRNVMAKRESEYGDKLNALANKTHVMDNNGTLNTKSIKDFHKAEYELAKQYPDIATSADKIAYYEKTYGSTPQVTKTPTPSLPEKVSVAKATGNMAEHQLQDNPVMSGASFDTNANPVASGRISPAGIVELSQVKPGKKTSTLPGSHLVSSAEQLQKGMIEQPKVGLKGRTSGDPISRGFIETIKNDSNTPQLIKDSISSLYTTRNTKKLQTKAANLVKDNPDMAHRVAMSNTGDVSQMVGSELIKHYGRTGDIESAISLAGEVAKQATEHGRATQALSAYSKLTPEGILRFTQKQIDRFNQDNGKTGKSMVVLSPDKAQSLFSQSERIQSMVDGRAKDIATAKMMNNVTEILPAGWVKKLSTVQTMGQLMNIKTATRNVLGNALFGGVDNLSQVGAAGIDRLTSKILGTERTTTLPSMKSQFKGLVNGAKDSIEEINSGVNLGPDTQFELSQVPVFKSKMMRNLEKTMGYELQVPDRAAYQAAFDDTVHGLMKVNKLDKPTANILEQANINGLYRTFQDNSKAAQLFSGIKKALNNVGVEHNGSRWGLGDLILKYPKTPGNILARGLDYSPVGIVKGLYQMVKPAITKQAFDQHTFANSISRGVVGTGSVMGAGAVLGALGIITEKPSTDTDTRSLQKASGQGGYQINTSALLRFFGSGFNSDAAKLQKNDTLVSYDWAQPMSIPLSAGAAIGKGQNAMDGATSTISNMAEGLNTLVEQPLLTGVNTLANNIKNKGVIGALGESAKGAPASFVPTGLNQVRQLADNTTRSTYNPNPWQQSMNMVINKVPGLDTILKPQVDTLGNEKENYQGGSNNLFNVLVNPAFVTQYNPQAAATLPLDMLARSGETQQMPKTMLPNQTVNGQTVNMTPQQNYDFQKYVGEHTNEYYNQLMKDTKFMARPDSEKASIMSAGLADITKAGKIVVLGESGKVSKSQLSIANGGSTYKNTTGSVTVADKLDNSSKSTLAKYNELSTADRDKEFAKSNDAEYQYNQAMYNNDKLNGDITPIQDISRKKAVLKDKVGSSYSKDARDLYGKSKAEIRDYLNSVDNGDKLYNELVSYDQALKKSGIITSLKFKNGLGSSSGGSSIKASIGYAAITATNKIRAPKVSKAPSFKTRYKSTALKNGKLASYKVPTLPKITKRKGIV